METRTSPTPPLGWPFWLCAAITLASSLISAGFSLAALSVVGDAHRLALYAASRSLALALTALLAVGVRSRAGLLTVAFAMALVQAGDAVIGALAHDTSKTAGPAGLALLTVGALVLVGRAAPVAR